jgi:hypothetical protein
MRVQMPRSPGKPWRSSLEKEGHVPDHNEETGERRRKDALGELQARIEAAVDEVRPKIKRAFEELDAKVDAAVADLKPRAQSAMRDVQPKVDQFVAEVQPRLDTLLERIQAKIDDLRRDLDARAARSRDEESRPAAQISSGPPTEPTSGSTDGSAGGI